MHPAHLSARRVDITTLDVDAIVNAANTALLPGGGVCGAIHRAAGRELARACAEVGPCNTGDARITPGFKLMARYVIHGVGPRWKGGNYREAEQLADAYRASMTLADANGCRSIAFPAISTGIYGYPHDEATTIAVATVRAYLAHTPSAVEQVIFACFDDTALDAYRRAGVTVE
jgi:O-acetyl-ADP-ribose deacetylase (regulator of RNase III)